ncbi:hypothetical protein Bbelb_208710 [Branchiostoma belcheri]|nr:hypothetical protein Bbelb_208710 [Branchiostoma belcheri]
MAGQVAGPYFAPVKGKVTESPEEEAGAEKQVDTMELGSNRNMGHNLLQYILNADPASSDDLRTTTSINESEFGIGRLSASPVLGSTEEVQRPSRLYHPITRVRPEHVERRCHLKNCNNNRVYEKHSPSPKSCCHAVRKTPPVLRHTCKSRFTSKGKDSSLSPHHIADVKLTGTVENGWQYHDMEDSFEDSGIEQSLDLPAEPNSESQESSPRDDSKDSRLVDTVRQQDRYHNDSSSPTDDRHGRGRKKVSADVSRSPDQRSCETRTTFCSSGMSLYSDRNAELAQGRAVLHTYRRKSSADLAQDLLKYQGKHKMLKYNGEHSETKLLKRPHTAPPTTAGQTAEYMLQRAYFSLEHADIKRRNAEIIKMQQEHTRHHQRLKHLFDLEWQQQQMRNMHLYARENGNSDGSYHDLTNMHHFNRKCCHGNGDHHGDGKPEDRARTAPPDAHSKSQNRSVPFPATKPFLMPYRQAKVTGNWGKSHREESNGCNGQKQTARGTSRTRRKESLDRMKARQRQDNTELENKKKAELWSTRMKWEPVKL